MVLIYIMNIWNKVHIMSMIELYYLNKSFLCNYINNFELEISNRI